MSDLFSALCQRVCSAKRFGIRDDRPNEPACLDTADGSKWHATVHNDGELEVTFTAIDNCIELRDAHGAKSERCEGVLTFEKTIVFVEAKERKGDARTWVKKADGQLRATIEAVERRVNLSSFTTKRAVIANRLRTRSAEKHTARMAQFEEEMGYVLTVDPRIRVS